MKSRCWVRSDYKIVGIGPLSDNHALLMSDIQRFKADASNLEGGLYVYSFRRGASSWQMCGVTDVQAPFLGPGDVPRAGF